MLSAGIRRSLRASCWRKDIQSVSLSSRPDGSFRAEDAPAGAYKLNAFVEGRPTL
jgi:hypothetical protein